VAPDISVLDIPATDIAPVPGPIAGDDYSITIVESRGTTLTIPPLAATASGPPPRTTPEIPIAGALPAASFNPTFAAPARVRSPASVGSVPRAAAANAS
jgi:hypothetical protein